MQITVLTGGTSSERDVALATASQVIAALRQYGHQVAAVDTARGYIPERDESLLVPARVGVTPPNPEELATLEQGVLLSGLRDLPVIRSADVIFLALHGGRGEDGTVQTILDVIGVPYTGSGPLGSAMAMDKDVSKRLFRASGVSTANWLLAPVTADQVTAEIGWPAVVKPSKQGSTVGLTVVESAAGLDAAVELAFRFDDEVLIETFVPGRELTVGILGDRALAVGEIIPRHDIFDYECKYTPGMSEELFPAPLDAAVAEECQQLGLLAHRALKLGGYSRVDFRLDPAGRVMCLEVNTLPGMTATSLYPQSARAVGIEFPELCHRICLAALDGQGRRPGPEPAA